MSNRGVSENFIEQERERNESNRPAISWIRKVLKSGLFKGLLLIIILAIVAPILVFYFFIDQQVKNISTTHTCVVYTTFRVPCGKSNITREKCLEINCCFDVDFCFHYLPSKYFYIADNENSSTPSLKNTPYGTQSLPSVVVSVSELDENRILVKLEKGIQKENKRASNGKYSIIESNNPVMVEIKKNDSIIFTTARGPLIMSETYWEWTIYLTNDTLYGLGETVIRLDEGTQITKVIYPNKFNHNTPPVIWAKQGDNFHGVILRHDGPLEITILPSNLIMLRGLTPSFVEIELAIGTSPLSLKQLQNNSTLDINEMENLLKTQICRGSNQIDLEKIIQEYKDNIDDLFDVECIHENIIMSLMKNDTKGLEELKNITKDIRIKNKSIYLPLPPHVEVTSGTFITANNTNMLYKVNTNVYIGKFKEQEVAYPDFSSEHVKEYIRSIEQMIKSYFNIEDINGFILTQNWPENEKQELENLKFPYLPNDIKLAITNTIPWYATNAQNNTHLSLHNKYGQHMVKAFKNYFPEKEIITSSNIYGNFEPAIVENVEASWANLKQILKNILFNNMIGNYFVNYPTCGSMGSFKSELHESLCVRWYLISATLPGFSVNSVQPRRNPRELFTNFSTEIVERAINTRKSLMPLYKTILNNAKPLVTPMFYYYFNDTNTAFLDEQYMLGEKILVAHPFAPNLSSLMVYFPTGYWYEMFTGDFLNIKVGQWKQISIVETDWISYVRGGSIIPFVIDELKSTILLTALCETNKVLEETLFLNTNCEAVVYATTENITITMKHDSQCPDPYEVNINFYNCNSVTSTSYKTFKNNTISFSLI